VLYLLTTASINSAFAFVPPAQHNSRNHANVNKQVQHYNTFSSPIFMSTDTTNDTTTSTTTAETAATVEDVTKRLNVPFTFQEMCRDASSAMTDAYGKGITRQIVRVLLPRDPSNANLGVLYENDAEVSSSSSAFGSDVVLVPPDETWQGGIMQLYRAAAPTAQEMLRCFSPAQGGIPPKMLEDRSVDESGVDGIGLWVTENVDAKDDVSCFVQPSQETVDYVEAISKQAGERLVMLLNPQWRSVDDALDASSKAGGFFGKLASSLGGKGGSMKRLDDLGYQAVFTIEGYVCKNRDIRLIKRFDSDWRVFAADAEGQNYTPVGSSKERPTYQECDKMLGDAGIQLSYL